MIYNNWRCTYSVYSVDGLLREHPRRKMTVQWRSGVRQLWNDLTVFAREDNKELFKMCQVTAGGCDII